MCESEQSGREAPPQWHDKIMINEALFRHLQERAERGDIHAAECLKVVVVANHILTV